ncbi:hypothetical protein [Actinocrispum sp. NPDC049592]|uniref:hypothetical protein n=1 Tax=Actinocrispum sp. NPDC049592 TaxID=3154835 RepID=UPI00343DA20E
MPDNELGADEKSVRHSVSSRVQTGDLLRDEFGQAWQHYRHLELLRGQYVSYAFSITLGAIALSIPLTSQVSASGRLLLITSIFLAFYALIIGSMYANVRKLRLVLWHYQGVIIAIRRYVYEADSNLQFDMRKFDVLSLDHPVIRGRLFRTQTLAESMLVAFLLADSVVAFLVARALVYEGAVWWQLCLVIVASCGVWAIAAAVIAFWVRYRRDIHADQGPVT